MNKDFTSLFHPIIADWFINRFHKPTGIQEKAWPEIAAGKNLLITAPTGSGKTLTAFLWSIHQLMTGAWPGGQVRVVYISPLKALNNDVHVNLIQPLSELKGCFEKEGKEFFPVRVLTRSGDTPQSERRLMQRRPPEILITTPESLNIIINSQYGRRLLAGVTSVILDEIHALVSNKRGTHLMTAVDRLVLLCGEFQRIALSATVNPPHKVSEFIGGYEMEGDPLNPVYKKRKVSIINSTEQKKLLMEVTFPEKARENMKDGSLWPPLIWAFKDVIQGNRSTLFFANSRRLTEKVTRFINENEPDRLAYAHHGSLSKEIRLVVEQKLKRGELRAIVATNSLELGIDIGDLDRVVLVQSPFSVSSAIQRIGRSGHGVRRTSKGLLFPTHGRDFLNGAVLAQCIAQKDIEPAAPITCPLDVLAQVILAMTVTETWDIDRLYGFLRTNWAYHHLSRNQFELVIEMMAGRYADTRIRELKPRISIDRIENTMQAKANARMLLNLAGGAIPDRGYFNLRLRDSKAKIGELDEEFVWERRVGETFAMGSQTWKIVRITHNDMEVLPAESIPGIIPFWRAEARNRDFHFSEKIGTFLEDAETQLVKETGALRERLVNNFFMEGPAVDELMDFLSRQREVTRASLPHRHHLLIEHFDDPLNRADSKQVILHTIWGGRINRPLALAMAAAWERKYGYVLEIFADDDSILLILPHAFDTADLLNLINAGNVEELLRIKLEKTGLFGAFFRENAGRALLLPKAGFKKRMPLWLNRLRSKKLLDAVKGTKNFPIILETWRTCLQDEFDMENLKLLLDELESGAISISQTTTTSASPFASGLIYQQTNKHMYEDDTPESGKISSLSQELIREIAGSKGPISGISDDLIGNLQQKLQRTAENYSPGSSLDLLDWVKERLIIRDEEWEGLLLAITRDHGLKEESVLSSIRNKLVRIQFPNAGISGICALEILPRIFQAFGLARKSCSLSPIYQGKESELEKSIDALMKDRPEIISPEDQEEPPVLDFLGQFLSFYGPVDETFLSETFGLSRVFCAETVKTLQDTGLVVGSLIREGGGGPEICYQENLEIVNRL